MGFEQFTYPPEMMPEDLKIEAEPIGSDDWNGYDDNRAEPQEEEAK